MKFTPEEIEQVRIHNLCNEHPMKSVVRYLWGGKPIYNNINDDECADILNVKIANEEYQYESPGATLYMKLRQLVQHGWADEIQTIHEGSIVREFTLNKAGRKQFTNQDGI